MYTQTILLCSSFQILYEYDTATWFGKALKDLRIAYIPTAAKGASSQDFLEVRRQEFAREGYHYEEIDIDDKGEEELYALLQGKDAVIVEGGSTFYLLDSVRRSGFDRVIKKLLPEGLIYIGGSAGSYICCPTIEMATWKHQDKYSHINIEDLKAMNLVPFLVTVHFKDEYREVVRKGIQNAAYPVRVLTDEQALLVQDGKVTLVGEGEEIVLQQG